MKALAIALSLWLHASVAGAQDVSTPASRILLVSDEDATRQELRAIAPNVAAELGVDVSVDRMAARDVTVVRVSVVGPVVHIEITRADGQRDARAFELPESPAERTHALVVVMVNLARDQTSDLLASLQGARAAGAIAAATAPEVARLDTSTPDAPEAEAPAVTVEPDAGSSDELDPWRHRLLRVGVGGQLGTLPEPGGFDVWGLWGVDVVALPIPTVGFGVRDLGGLMHAGNVVIGFAPVVELAYWPLRSVGLHAIIGCDIQTAASEDGPTFGVAPRLGLGARLRILPMFSVAADVTTRVVATDAYRVISGAIPQGAVPIVIGLSLALHV